MNHTERFCCTLRQHVSRPVRKTLSFSRKDDSHIRSIRYFIWKFNAALLVWHLPADVSVNLLSEINNDPADRRIAATAVIYDVPLLTADWNLRQAECIVTVWQKYFHNHEAFL